MGSKVSAATQRVEGRHRHLQFSGLLLTTRRDARPNLSAAAKCGHQTTSYETLPPHGGNDCLAMVKRRSECITSSTIRPFAVRTTPSSRTCPCSSTKRRTSPMARTTSIMSTTAPRTTTACSSRVLRRHREVASRGYKCNR